MRIDSLTWTDGNIEHIARHGIRPSEVEEVCFGDRSVAIRVGRGRYGGSRYAVYGQAESGRYLVVFIDGVEGARFFPVTARDMTERERRRYGG